MFTTRENKQAIAKYQIGLQVIEAIQAIKASIVGKVANKRITDKITMAIEEKVNNDSYRIYTAFKYGCLDITFSHKVHYKMSFDLRLSSYNVDLIDNGRLDGESLEKVLSDSSERFTAWTEEAKARIAVLPEVIEFLKATIKKAEEYDNKYKFYLSLTVHEWESFIERETNEK